MKYIYLENATVQEIIPEVNPVFPGVPIEERYPADFLLHCVAVEDDVKVEQHMIYDEKSGTFAYPEPAEKQLEEVHTDDDGQ